MAPSPSPWLAADRRLRAELEGLAGELAAAGRHHEAQQLRQSVEAWWSGRQGALGELHHALGVHHEINNALVGVSGNVQLLLLGPAAQQAGVRERLEVILREAERIKVAALRLRELRGAVAPGEGSRRAA